MKLSLIDALAVHLTYYNDPERPGSLYRQARQVTYNHAAELRRLHQIELKEEQIVYLKAEIEEMKK